MEIHLQIIDDKPFIKKQFTVQSIQFGCQQSSQGAISERQYQHEYDSQL